jgi:hypothetical protein
MDVFHLRSRYDPRHLMKLGGGENKNSYFILSMHPHIDGREKSAAAAAARAFPLGSETGELSVEIPRA